MARKFKYLRFSEILEFSLCGFFGQNEDFWNSVLNKTFSEFLIFFFQFQRKRMPDGHNKIYGAQVIYSNVTRKHSGTYVCEGSNGSGFIAKDTIKIDVIRKFFKSFSIAAKMQ